MSPVHFGDALVQRIRSLGHPLCVGLDPHLPQIPALFRRGSMTQSDPQTAEAVQAFCMAMLDRVAGKTAVIKPQIALFEQLGPAGFEALARVNARARELDLLIIMDAKRGDIGSTAEGYAAAYLHPGAPFASDALTVNPFMGLDTLQPYLDSLTDHGRGLFALVKTSNPGSASLQDVVVTDTPLYAHLANLLAPVSDRYRGPATGWSSLGAVVGATYPEQAQQLRERMPHTLFLIPGYGAQGASARDAVRSFVPGPAGLEGGIVNASRAVLFPAQAASADSLRAWENAIDESLSKSITDLGEAVSHSG